MNLRIASLVTTIMLLALTGFAAACGGGGDGDSGPLTLEQYFERLEKFATDFEDRWTAAQDEFDFTIADPEEEALELTRGFFKKGLTVLEDFVDDLEGLDAPAEATEAHEAATTAGRELVEMFENAVTVIEVSESIDEVAAILEAPGFTEASDSFTDSCFELQDLAYASDISVDLLCGD